MELLPAIDLRRGRVVRLTRGDDRTATVYGDDPEAVLRAFAAAGATLAHVVDLDAALGEAPQTALLRRLPPCREGERPALQIGGGLRDAAAVHAVARGRRARAPWSAR